MSKTLAEQIADEWWFKVREYGKKHKDPFKSGRLEDMIEYDLEMSAGRAWSSRRDIARAAVEILKVMLEEHRRREARHGVQKPSC